MGGFDFGGDADDDRDPPTDDGVSFGADGTDGADTVVSPAEPSPLDDPGSLGSTDDTTSDGAGTEDRFDDSGDGTDDRTGDEIGDGAVPTSGTDPIEPLLYAGEEVRASLPVADGRLVATDHRVLAYAPDADPDERATLRAVHRVNVTDVSPSSTATDWLVRPIAYTVVGGLAMVLGGSVVSFDSMGASMPDSAGATGLGGLLSMVGGVLSVLSIVDDALRVAGAVSLLLGVALMGVYAATRGREVVVETEGEADTLRVDAAGVDDDAVERFRAEAGVGDERTSGTLQRLFGR
ncbi:hypothetical protein [Halobaculum roseum]|uniref:Uncharacterized protein n=1 Tax=Halobaculum roseum TaxID=2175149 RepID=A0ABD5MTY0_9EURY|nr:hypothetical protein [Halobaculum roseum]QZY02182.1 hypothetical protein K6T36_12855 [Halobaculum roseum]